VRESPAYDVIGLLEERGADVSYHDPYVPEFEVEGKEYESVELTEDQLGETDLVLVLTDHSDIDFGRVVDGSSMVFDTRNATDGMDDEVVYRL
jgi:UDP-N-acetyl-D-glucosamine dehydrogenase